MNVALLADLAGQVVWHSRLARRRSNVVSLTSHVMQAVTVTCKTITAFSQSCMQRDTLFRSDDKKYCYNNVRRWTSKMRLDRWGQPSATVLECDKLIMPVHLGCHWTCAVINLKEREIWYFDSLGVRIPHASHACAAACFVVLGPNVAFNQHCMSTQALNKASWYLRNYQASALRCFALMSAFMLLSI